MKPTILSLLAATALASCGLRPAYGAGIPLPALTPHGTPAATDLFPVQPAGGTTLLSSTAADVANYVLTSVKAYGAKGDGVTDDTVAIQAAINTGLPIYFPPGVYVTSATLVVESYTNNGQVLRGAGSYYSAGSVGFSTTPPPGTAVLRPSAAMSGKPVFIIDGTPIAGAQLSWVQGFGIENLAIDMTNMSDVLSSVAIEQIQAWDGHYRHVRVLNDGANKRAWLFKAGAFTSHLDSVQGNILDFEGSSNNYGVTTMLINNCDCGRVISNYAGNLFFFGGAFQGFDGSTKFYLRNSFDIRIETDVEGTGVFLDVDGTDNFLFTRTELQGFTGTYMNGTPGHDNQFWDQQTSYYTGCQFDFSNASIRLNGCGNGSNKSQFLSGSATNDQYLFLGRTAGETLWGVAGEANWFVGGAAQGDTIFGSTTNSNVWLMADGVAGAKITPTGFYTFGTGILNEQTVNVVGAVTAAALNGYVGATGEQILPPTDGQSLSLENAAGTAYAIATSSATIASSSFALGNGARLTGYSDNFSTLSFNVNAINGLANFAGETLTPITDGGALVVYNHAGVSVLSVTTNATAANSSVVDTGSFTAAALASGTTISANSKVLISSTPPTYSTGFSTGTPTIAGSTTAAFTVTLGATPGATGVLTMPAAATGWVCLGSDRTTAAGTIRETATTLTSVTFALTSGVAGDVLQLQCFGQ